MPRYAAFLRAVSPQNARMPALKEAFEGPTSSSRSRWSGRALGSWRSKPGNRTWDSVARVASA